MESDPTYDISVVRKNGETISSPGDDQGETAIDCEAPLRAAVTATLRRHQIREARIVVALVNDADMRLLNQEHLGHDEATDVLAFDLRDEEAGKNSGNAKVEGDLVLSTETAVREAKRRGHDLAAELCLYAVHGTLHFLGFDDHTEDGATRMHEIEDSILVELGVGRVFHPDGGDP